MPLSSTCRWFRLPTAARPFKTPLVPVVPLLGVLVCSGMIISLDRRTQVTALVWMLIGFVIYFVYSRSNSVLNAPGATEGRQPAGRRR